MSCEKSSLFYESNLSKVMSRLFRTVKIFQFCKKFKDHNLWSTTSLCRSPPGMTEEKSDRREKRLLKIVCNVGKQYIQAVYLPMRTQYLTLKMEQKCTQNQRQQMIHQLQETCSEKLIREMRSLVSRLQHIQFQNTNPKYFPRY